MSDRVSALLAEAGVQEVGLERASQLDGPRLPVDAAFESLLPDRGLRPGTLLQVTGIGATSIALSLVSVASQESWIAVVGIPALGLRAACELGVDLGHLVVVSDPGKQAAGVLGAVVDAFDIVIVSTHQARLPAREARRLAGRVRERDAVFLAIGEWESSDVRIEGCLPRWHGIDDGHGHLAARSLEVSVTGRRSAARPNRATLWLPDHDGRTRIVERSNIVSLVR
jgi:hypothetical protein